MPLITWEAFEGKVMIFPKLSLESIVQVNDKTRLDATMSFLVNDSIQDIEIEPETGVGFISINNLDTTKLYLDWSYSTSGTKTISLKVTSTSLNVVTITKELDVITEEEDNLFSNDSQIFAIESELKKYIPPGKSSFNHVHREAQSRILNFFDRKRIWNTNGEPLTKTQVNLQGELSRWSLYESLYIIYTDLFLSVGDKFAEKINQYKELRAAERDKAVIRIDKDNSGTIDPANEFQDLKTFRLIKR